MKNKIRHKRLAIVFIIFITIIFVWSSFGNFSKIKKENIKLTKIRLLENEQVIQESEPDFNSNSLIVQTQAMDVIEENLGAMSVKTLTEDIYLIDFEDSLKTKEAY